MEIVLRIVKISTSSSQSSYRSLVLTSRIMREVVRLECLPLVPVILTKAYQLCSFLKFISSSPEIALSIRFLSTILSDSKTNGHCVFILRQCTNIESLACDFYTLYNLCSDSTFHHLRCTHLTLKGRSIQWNQLLPTVNYRSFAKQLSSLHLIGPFTTRSQWTGHRPPAFENLTSASFSYGRDEKFDRQLFVDILRSPRLQRVAIVTALQDPQRARLSSTVKELGSRCRLVIRPRRWTENKMWIDGLHDEDCIWKLESPNEPR